MRCGTGVRSTEVKVVLMHLQLGHGRFFQRYRTVRIGGDDNIRQASSAPPNLERSVFAMVGRRTVMRKEALYFLTAEFAELNHCIS